MGPMRQKATPSMVTISNLKADEYDLIITWKSSVTTSKQFSVGWKKKPNPFSNFNASTAECWK